jgi:hypothetical protein
MALTSVKEPRHVNLSMNPIDFTVSTNKYLLTPGAKTNFQILITDIPNVEDETMSFTFPDGNRIEFVTKTTPDDSATQIPKTYSTGGGPVLGGTEKTIYAQQLLTYIKKNHKIRNSFNLTASPTGLTDGWITFIAKDETDETNVLYLTSFTDFEWSGIDVTGVAPVYNDNFFAGADVFVEDVKNSGTFVLAGTLFGVPDDNNEITFDLQKILNPYLGNDFLPQTTVDAIICSNNCKRFYVEYYEFYGKIPVEKEVIQSDTYLVLKGALRHIDYYRPDSETPYDNFWDYLVDSKTFLTWKKTRRINKTQREFLYWFNNYTRAYVSGDPDIVYLRCKVYYTDGTTDEDNGCGDATSVNDDVVMFPCGYNDVSNFFNPGKVPFKYECWLQADFAGDIITEKITFYIEEADFLDKEFYYENSLGGFETLRTFGIHEFNSEITSEEARRNLTPGAARATTDRTIFSINTSQRGVNVGRTGGIDNKLEAQVIREFFMSEETYAVNDKGKIYGVVITPDTKPESIDDYNLFGYEFEYKEAFINKGYSNY